MNKSICLFVLGLMPVLVFSQGMPLTPALPAPSATPDSVQSVPNNAPAPAVHVAPEMPIYRTAVIKSYYVEVPFNKTLTIIFPRPVKSADMGSRFIIADKAVDVENVLKVKALRMGFNETNFSVITDDGKFYSFVATYNESPAILALNLINNNSRDEENTPAGRSTTQRSAVESTLIVDEPVAVSKAQRRALRRREEADQKGTDQQADPVKTGVDRTDKLPVAPPGSLPIVAVSQPAANQPPRKKPVVTPVPTAPGDNTQTVMTELTARTLNVNGQNSRDGMIVFSGVRAKQNEVVANCERILGKRRTVRHVGVEANLMEAAVRGVYVKDNVFYYKVSLANNSNINYDVDFIRFFIVDKVLAKRSSAQEIEVTPFYVHHDGETVVKGNSRIDRVYAFQKFTMPDNKRLVVTAGEVNGGRTLNFVINNSDIMNADKL